eukprot:TRINITY_DN2010_c0_g1_i1.p1 TRINITY_DN2010_c0_g1~~TRINITY_DN2010_c0_g1_i1.p1  ORF type:complete len:290 (+),score=61.08 TRINITY_DN2010_c0_g1_i1:215-1084(+)
MSRLSGSNVLITGAGMGIGREMALLFAKSGANLILWDIRQEGLTNVAKEVEAIAPRARVLTFTCDVANRFNVYETAVKVLEKVGKVDILINNAGIVSGGALLSLDDEQIIRTFEVNSLAHFWTVRAFLPAMIAANEGHIVTISSAAGLIGAAGMTDYSASKFACFGFHESLRLELKHQKKNIRTTIVCPAFINTGMFDGYRANTWLTPPLQPTQVAQAVLDAVKYDRLEVSLPVTSYVVYLLRMFPVRVFDWLIGLLGISKSMDSFKGRGKNFSLAGYKEKALEAKKSD